MKKFRYSKVLKNISTPYYNIVCKSDDHPSVADKTKQFFNHCHNHYEVLFFIEGEADITLENRKFHLTPHTLVFIRPQQYHYVQPEEHRRYVRMVLSFDDNIVSKNILDKIFAHDIVQLNSKPELIHILEQYRTSHTQFSLNDINRYKRACITTFLLLISPHMKYLTANAPAALSFNPLIRDTINYINQNFHKDIGLDSIAKEFFVSKYYLSSAFSKHINVTISNYINYKRIIFAQGLILKGASPSEVYTKSGFNNYTTFYRLYCKHLGCSPSEHKPKGMLK